MKYLVLRAFSIFTLAFLAIGFSTAHAADTNPPPRLTVELRDGSRVIGASGEKYFKFRSALLGEFKLAVKDIRAVECVATNSATLTTVNGDVLTVSFLASEIAIKASFGKVAIPVDSIRKFAVSTTGKTSPQHEGLVALWSAEGNANDSAGANNGALVGNVKYAPGKFGQAFDFSGTNGYVQIGGGYALAGARTIEGWVFPASNTEYGLPIMVGGTYGACDYFGIAGTTGNCDVGQNNLYIDHFGTPCCNGNIAVKPNEWNHVAMVYDGNQLRFYVNGVAGPVLTRGLYDYNLNTCTIGGNIREGSTTKPCFNGLIDELSIYNRALTAGQIREDYEAGN